MLSLPTISSLICSERIRIRGTVQGVGFRPTVWSLAKQFHLKGSVCNDGEGVLLLLYGEQALIDKFVSTLQENIPPLAYIDSIERQAIKLTHIPIDFVIETSEHSHAHTHLPVDAATCEACLQDINNPDNRRYRYAFTNCTHCGPRLSIIKGIPYDRSQTTMADFVLCDVCWDEYNNPADRRFHAQPNACSACGPEVWLEEDGEKCAIAYEAICLAAERLKAGKIVAIKGVAGIHLAVDAHNDSAVRRLRKRKNRLSKPLALMAKDCLQIERYCQINSLDAQQLQDSSAPIVLLPRQSSNDYLSDAIAPNQAQLGFMLPYSPLHHLLMQCLEHPIVLTSGNLSNEPQCIDNQDVLQRLQPIADCFLLHSRKIENRLDDSVTRFMAGSYRLYRRARGYAPRPIRLPDSFAKSPDLLAMGGELKNTFCLLKDQQAVLSQHMGDLENCATYEDYQKNLRLYQQLYQHQAEAIVVDKHPEYLSTKLGKAIAKEQGIPLIEVQHHHAHIAACLAENQQPLSGRAVLGIALDGLGYGDDDLLWGGEFLLADYYQSKRLACLRPAPLIGGSQAMREPWRNTYAQLYESQLWDDIQHNHTDTAIVDLLKQQPLNTFNRMIEQSINCPAASSCGRLFDAVAAAIGICPEAISYEGQAAIEMEALLASASVNHADAYPFDLLTNDGVTQIDPSPLWRALFADLSNNTPQVIMSARFHYGLANSLVSLAKQFIKHHQISQVVLTGGVFQNKTLFETVLQGLQNNVEVLTHRQVPANDGGLSLGQAAIAAAQLIKRSHSCA